MVHQHIKNLLNTSIREISDQIDNYSVNSNKDFSRNRKVTSDLLMSFLLSQGASNLKSEILDFFEFSSDSPTASAIVQQRAKLKPEALESLFLTFNQKYLQNENTDIVSPFKLPDNYCYIAADGSSITYFSSPRWSSSDYYVSEGHSMKGFYSMHINAFFDLGLKLYTKAVVQPVHEKDEFRAFCQIVDTHPQNEDKKNIYIGDRGYCSYNNMAHVIEKEHYFLFRTKDKDRKGLIGNFKLPESDTFDTTVQVTLVRSHSKKILIKDGYYRRFIDKDASFDFIPYKSADTYDISFRVVRIKISDTEYECLVTNLPEDIFPAEILKEAYNARWSIESSFRKLKYTIGLSSFHSYKPECIKQEIWAKFLAYNITELLVRNCVIEQSEKEKKHIYQVNFSRAAHIARVYLRLTSKADSIDVMELLKKELTPIRNDRKFPRLKTAHFRRPKYFLYRAS